MNEPEQFEFESYLREFRPRTPKALPLEGPRQNWRRIAAAIAVFFLGAASLWSALHYRELKGPIVTMRAEEPPVAASAIPLTKLALEKPTEFEAALNLEASKTLNKFDRTDSALRALAKE